MAAFWIPVRSAFAASAAFSFFYNVRSARRLLFHGLGGALGWMVYLLAAPLGGGVMLQSFLAAMAISLYAEVMARMFRAPATGYLQVAFLPLVPGGGIYYTMEYCINGDMENFASKGLETLGIAGSLAIGVLLVSSLVRMWGARRRRA